MAPVKLRPQDVSLIMPEPATAPVATRAWCVRDPRAPEDDQADLQPAGRWKPPQRPRRFLALQTECVTSATALLPGFEGERWASEGQALLFGHAAIGRTYDWRIEREVIFHPDDLPDSGLGALRRYVGDRTYRRGAPPRKDGDAEPDLVWRDRPRTVVELVPLSGFLKRFWWVAYKDRGLVVGFDLAYHISRLAAIWREVKKGRNLGGWHLDLWTFREPVSGEERPSAGWRPGIILKRVTPEVVFIEFTGRRGDGKGEKGSRYRGEFFDLANLARGLTGRHWTLPEAVTAFTGEVIESPTEHGTITPSSLDCCRTRLHATLSLTETLLSLFDRLHPVSRGAGGRLSETRVYSAGGLARSYFSAAGISPPTIQEDRLGPCVSGFFGGWAEVQLRGRAPVVHVDFRRQYQMVSLLQEHQGLLVAGRLQFIEDTEAIRAFVEHVTIDELLLPATWPKLNALCWIRPAGEIMVGRWALDERGAATTPDRFSLAMTPRHSDEPVVAYLGDVIASKFLCDRTPEIIRAERIIPIVRQRLRRARLFGGAIFDPAGTILCSS